jgi:anti-sigma factor RsiW
MNTRYECDRQLLVQADFDGELDAARAADLLSHRATCEHCQAAELRLASARKLVRAVPRMSAPERLRAQIAARVRAVDDQRVTPGRTPYISVRGRWHLWFGWATAAAAMLVASMTLLAPDRNNTGAQLVDNHLRAMQLDSHLLDVVSSEHHTVKPWFAGKVAFAPPVKELGQDYPLKGGRVDVVNGNTAAVLVYQAGRHIVDVYVWPADRGATPSEGRIEGFNLRKLQSTDLEVWCASDMGAEELDRFVDRWRASR